MKHLYRYFINPYTGRKMVNLPGKLPTSQKWAERILVKREQIKKKGHTTPDFNDSKPVKPLPQNLQTGRSRELFKK